MDDSNKTNLSARIAQIVLDTPAELDRADARLLSILRVGMVLGAFFHASFALVFWLNSLGFLAAYNAVVTVLFGVAAWIAFNYGRPALFAGVALALVEMPVHGWLATWYTGIDTLYFLHPLALLAAAPFVSFLTMRQRTAVILYLAAWLAWIILHGHIAPPLASIDPVWAGAMGVGNVLFIATSLALISTVYAVAVQDAEARASAEHARAERLLHNILPHEIAERLKDAPEVIADEHTEATILFADIVGFTERFARLTPTQLIDRLNRVFSAFDALAAKHGVEKIKTIGDAYMVVAGLPKPRADHAAVIVRMAQDMLAELDRINQDLNEPIRLRIGINTGPVVAGVIGQTKFAYDLWGDAVNVASRLEEIAEPGQVRIGEATRDALSADFPCTELDRAEVKGKGVLRTWALDLAAG